MLEQQMWLFFIPVNSPQEMGNTQTFQKARLAVCRLAGWQLALTVVLAVVALVVGSGEAATAVLTGGFIGMLAGFYQAQRLLRVDAGMYPEAFLRGLWISEALKIVLTVAMFIAAIQLLRVQMVPTIIGYAGTYIVYWVALGTRYPWFETVAESTREKNWPEA
ncbi:MAG: ATP synthase subunit I [Gammaproteobacteria bacterium]|nr:ATP synthase subunit I [Gammaproteobacteria bacterium]MDP6654403.1 ATP synthase subunit I [Gammaproteobacteria bacterium]MDP6694532.1 ATP synthase subunit I [Gammaproteobacteria bacterium]